MAGLLDLFSGRASDLYGEGLLTPEQRGGLGNIGLLALAGKLGQLAGPSFSPVPDFGAALGQAAGAYGASQEGAGTAALNAILTAQKGRKLQQELDYYQKLGPVLGKLAGDWPGAGGGAGGGEGSGSTGGGAAAPLDAGGGGADPSETDIIGRESGGKPYVGYGGVDLSNKPLNEFGFPIWEGRMGPAGISHAAGLYQFQPGTWATYAGPLGIKDFSPESQRKVYLAARAAEGARPWAASAGGAAPSRGAAAPTAAAPAGGGGLLAPTAPNPLSDAEPMVGIPRPAAPAGAGAAAGGSPDDAALRQQYAAGIAATRQWAKPGEKLESFDEWKARLGVGANSGGGGLLAAPPGAGTDSYVTPQGPAGDLGPPGPAGPATPRAPLPTMGPAGIELPPMQGPLAAPPPAAAGPGLLAAPGAPAAALPRVNPAYDAYLRNLGVAGALAKGAGLPDVFGPLTGALKDSPAYQAQVELAKRLGVLPLIGPEETEKARVKLQYDPLIAGKTREAQQPYILQEELFKNQMKMLGEGRVWDEKAGTFISAPGYAQTMLDQEIAKAEGSKSQETTTKVVRGQDGRDYTVTIPVVEYLKELRDNLRRNQQAGTAPPTGQSVQPGQISPQPASTPEELKSQEIDLKRLEEKRVAAEASRLAIQNANDTRQLVERGVITGAGADNRTQLLKLGQLLKLTGKDDNALIANTEAFIAQQGTALKDALRGLGPPVSDRDALTAEKISGGQNLTVQGLLELMQIKDKYHRQALTDYNEMAKTAPPSRFERTVKEPPTYGAQTATGPNGDRLWKNPNTGKWMPF